MDLFDKDDYDYKVTWKGKYTICDFKRMMAKEIESIKKSSKLLNAHKSSPNKRRKLSNLQTGQQQLR